MHGLAAQPLSERFASLRPVWFAYFRLYGPEKAFFDKTWKLPDVEAMN